MSSKEYFISALTGDDRNTGSSEQQAWLSLRRLAEVPDLASGTRIFLQRGSIWNESLRVPASGLWFAPFGEGSRPRIDRRVDIKGTEADWTQVKREPPIWRRELNRPQRHCLILGQAIAPPRRDRIERIKAAGEWATAASSIFLCAPVNPGGPDGPWTSIETTAEAIGFDSNLKPDVVVEELDVLGVRRGFVLTASASLVDCRVQWVGQVGIQISGSGEYNLARCEILDVAPIGQDLPPFGSGAGEHGLYVTRDSLHRPTNVLVVAIDLIIDNTGEDNIQLAGCTKESQLVVRSSKPGLSRLTRPGSGENNVDIKTGNFEADGVYMDVGGYCFAPITAHGSGLAVRLRHCAINARNNQPALQIQHTRSSLESRDSRYYSRDDARVVLIHGTGQGAELRDDVLLSDHPRLKSGVIQLRSGMLRLSGCVLAATGNRPPQRALGISPIVLTKQITSLSQTSQERDRLLGTIRSKDRWQVLGIGTWFRLTVPQASSWDGLYRVNDNYFDTLSGEYISTFDMPSERQMPPAPDTTGISVETIPILDEIHNCHLIVAGEAIEVHGAIRVGATLGPNQVEFTSEQAKVLNVRSRAEDASRMLGDDSLARLQEYVGSSWTVIRREPNTARIKRKFISRLEFVGERLRAFASDHGFRAGQRILLSGAEADELNGWIFLIAADEASFDFQPPRGYLHHADFRSFWCMLLP